MFLQLLQLLQFAQSQPQEVFPFFLFRIDNAITPPTIPTANTIIIISIGVILYLQRMSFVVVLNGEYYYYQKR